MTFIDGIILGVIGIVTIVIVRRLWKTRGKCASGCSTCDKTSLCTLDLYQEYQKAKTAQKSNDVPNNRSTS